MLDLDPLLSIAGLFIGFVVGLTGMGGGALMTPVLVLFFGVAPLTAVSSDLLVSLFMKPVGGAVHAKRGTVHRGLVLWLCLGSVPAAFAGVLLLKALGDGEGLESAVRTALGVALLLAVSTMLVKGWTQLRRHAAVVAGREVPSDPDATIHVRRGLTLAVGVAGGLIVGMTSVGSGSLIIVMLLLLHPRLTPSHLVGTDLVQAVPLVAAATLGHLLFGDVELGLTASLLIGALPGVYLGARVSTVAPQRLVKRALVVVLFASALKLLRVPDEVVGPALLAALVVGPLVWMLLRRQAGLPMSWRAELRRLSDPDAADRAAHRVDPGADGGAGTGDGTDQGTGTGEGEGIGVNESTAAGDASLPEQDRRAEPVRRT